MGLAVHKPRLPEDNYAVIYYPPAPRAMIEVVDPDDPVRVVEYGETGLREWADRVRAQSWREAFVFFKHEDEATGPRLATQFGEMIGA